MALLIAALSVGPPGRVLWHPGDRMMAFQPDRSIPRARALVLALAPGLAIVLAPAAAAASGEAIPDPRYEYRVDSVPEDDELNVRAQPGTRADIVDELAPDTTGVVVTGVRRPHAGGTWWEIVRREGETAWVNARFLARAEGPALQVPLRCSGTEPFWSLEIEDDEATFSRMGGEGEAWTAAEWKGAEGFLAGHRFAIRLDEPAPTSARDSSELTREGGGRPVDPAGFSFFGYALADHGARAPAAGMNRGEDTSSGWVTIARAMDHCTDEMSDNRYPFDTILITPAEDVLAGCCARAR